MPNTTNQNSGSKVSKSLMNSPYMQNYSENKPRQNPSAGMNRGYVPRAQAPMAFPQPHPTQKKVAVQVASPVVAENGAYVSSRKKKKQMKKMLRGRSDHFYVQRRGTTFLIMLITLILIAAMAIGSLGILPMLSGVVKEPDYTPEDERTPTKVDGEEVPYEDKSIYYSPLDSLMGMIKTLTKKDLYAEKMAALEEEFENTKYTDEEKEAMIKELDIYKSAFYDAVMLKFEEKQITGILPMLFQYSAVFVILVLLIAIFTLIKCLASLRGKRIYKRFGLTGLLLIVLGAGMLFSGFIGSDALTKNMLNPAPEETTKQSYIIEDGKEIIDNIVLKDSTEFVSEDKVILAKEEETTEEEPTVITELLDYIMGAFSSYPETKDPEITNAQYVSGFLPLIIIVVGVLMLIMSLFTKRKISYSIFENIK